MYRCGLLNRGKIIKFALMKLVRLCLAMLVLAVCLSGCRSGKRAVSGPGSYDGSGQAAYYPGEDTDAMGEALAAEARRWLGTPYRYGGADRSGTDCSGLVMELYRSVCAVKLPRTTTLQKSYCTKVARNRAKVGDLMFFGSGKGGGAVSHVGLYIGKGEMIHASSSRGVMVSRVDKGYWGTRFNGVGRVDGAYESWAAINGKGKTRKKHGKGKVDATPSPMSVPAPALEIAYDRLPVSGHGINGATPPSPAPASPSGKTAAPSVTPSAAVEATATIDLLDLIINQKVDSIFSDRVMD